MEQISHAEDATREKEISRCGRLRRTWSHHRRLSKFIRIIKSFDKSRKSWPWPNSHKWRNSPSALFCLLKFLERIIALIRFDLLHWSPLIVYEQQKMTMNRGKKISYTISYGTRDSCEQKIKWWLRAFRKFFAKLWILFKTFLQSF